MTVEKYIVHLITSPVGNSCVKAGDVLEVSHDHVTRLLNKSSYTGKDLFDKAIVHLASAGGTVSVDDSVIDKPYSNLESNDLVGRFWSGKHHQVVKGVNLVTLVYTDKDGYCLPVNFRLYDPHDRLSKHDLMQEMVREVLDWGLSPAWITADAWYASIGNLKFFRGLELSFQVGVQSDRIVSTEPGVYEQVGQIRDIPDDGLYTHLKKFGFVKVFRTVGPDGDARHYIVHRPDTDALQSMKRQTFKAIKKIHWNVEKLFRAMKQACNLERFFVRKAQAVNNHVFCALRAFQRIYAWQKDGLVPSIYAVQKVIFLKAQRDFIQSMAA